MTLHALQDAGDYLERLLAPIPSRARWRIHRMNNLIVPPNWGHGARIHVDDFHLLYVKGGQPIYALDGTEYRLRQGMVVFVSHGCEMRLSQDPKEPPNIIPIRFDRYRSGASKPLPAPKGTCAFALAASQSEVLCSLFEQLFACWLRRDNPLSLEMSSSLLQVILWAIREECVRRGMDKQDHSMEEARLRLESEPEANWKIADLARSCNVSVSHFSRRFCKHTGVPPKTYHTQARMRYARLMLEQGQVNVQQMAARLGYSDAFVFSRQFKKYWGVSPSKV